MFYRKSTILITGAAGFIGYHLIKRLLLSFPEIQIIGLDNMIDYYDVELKKWRLSQIDRIINTIQNKERWAFICEDIRDNRRINELFEKNKIDVVIHLAAQAGVRDSIINPRQHIETNIIGFFNVLEACKKSINHLIYASSSSVYGDNTEIPFSENQKTDRPISLYATTKKTDELLAYTYSKLYGIKTTGLRFFTVYGPAGRPDMAYFKFTNQWVKGETVSLYNNGDNKRDYTYIDDIVECIIRILLSRDKTPYAIYNIGKGHPETSIEFLSALQSALIKMNLLPKTFNYNNYTQLVEIQQGDMKNTIADTNMFKEKFDYIPHTQLLPGLMKFVTWYKDYYSMK